MAPFRFVHTGDWQIGMMARGLGAASQRVRDARIEAIQNVLEVADERDAKAVLVAGDLFEDNQVDAATVEQVANLLNDATDTPIWIIPGNHDPLTRDSVYHRPVWSQLKPHVCVLRTAEPVAIAEQVTLYPCPLFHKNGYDDPTAWIPPRDDNSLRIGLAHGTLPLQKEMGEDDFPIPLDAATQHELDYLALGHWHSVLSHPTTDAPRTWYSGKHETTRFGERNSGNALVVDLQPDQHPKVEVVPTGVLNWTDHEIDLDQQSLDAAMTHLRSLPNPDTTLLRVAVVGQAHADTLIDDLAALLEERFLYHSLDTHALRPALMDEQLKQLLKSPHLIQTAEQLRAIAAGDVESEATKEVATRAVQLLQQAAWEHRNN